MTEVTKNIRTHTLILNDKRKIPITQEQYNNLQTAQLDSKFSDPLKIIDADSWEILFDWKYGAIKEFEHKKRYSPKWQPMVVCDFWNRHPLSMWGNCDCGKKFGCLSIEFKERLQKMWFEYNYSNEITKVMQTIYKQKYLK